MIKYGILIILLAFTQLPFCQNLDCVTAELICTSGSFDFNPLGIGIDDFANPNNDADCLLTNERSSAWYIFNIRTDCPPNTNLGFILDPESGNGEDYDFAIYGPDVTCDNLGFPVRCSYADHFCFLCPLTGLGMGATDTSEPANFQDGFVAELVVNPGEQYILLIDNFLQTGDGFSLTWTGPGAPFLDCVTCEAELELTEDVTICEEPYEVFVETIFNALNDAPQFVWSSSNPNFIIDDPSAESTTIAYEGTVSAETEIIVCLLDEPVAGEPCEACDTMNITILIPGDLVVEPQGPYCQGEVIILDVDPDQGGIWIGDISSNSGEIYTDEFAPGLYNATYLYQLGDCDHELSYSYEILGLPSFLTELVDIDYCDPNAQLILEITNLENIDWIDWSIPQDAIIIEGGLDESMLIIEWHGLGTEQICVTVGGECGPDEPYCIDIERTEDEPPVLMADPVYCISSDSIIISTTVEGGVFTGNGIVDDVDGQWDPSLAGVGTHNITYELQGECPMEAMIELSVIDTLAPITIACGDFDVDFVSFDWLHPTATEFIVTIWIDGVMTIDQATTTDNFYTVTGLLADQIVSIEVRVADNTICNMDQIALLDCSSAPCPLINIDMPNLDNLCESENGGQFLAEPDGGLFLALINIDPLTGLFSPSDLDPGTYTAYYILDRPGGCQYQDSATVSIDEILPPPDVNCSMQLINQVTFEWSHPSSEVNQYELSYSINGGPALMQMSSNLTLTISDLAPLDEVVLSVVAVGINSCGDSEPAIAICKTLACPINPPNIEPVGLVCISNQEIVLMATPVGGNFSGPGVNTTEGTFYPELAGIGLHQITYQVFDEFQCLQENSIMIEVEPILPAPDVNCIFQGITSVIAGWSHEDPSVQEYLLSYSINGGAQTELLTQETQISIENLMEGDVVQFWITAIGYNTCGNSATVSWECIASHCPENPIQWDDRLVLCNNNEEEIRFMASPAGGLYSSNDLRVDPNGTLHLMGEPAGIYTILYDYVDENDCTYQSVLMIELISVIDPPQPICLNQTLNSVTFGWPANENGEYEISYFINGTLVLEPTITMDTILEVSNLNQGDSVVLILSAVQVDPCMDDATSMTTCHATNCNIEISGLPQNINLCAGEGITLSPTVIGAGSEFNYRWITPLGEFDTIDIVVTEMGSYRLEVSDELGCLDIVEFTVNVNDFTPIISISDPLCFMENNGSIEIIEIIGDNPPYLVSLNGVEFVDTYLFENLSAGSYDLEIEDSQNCYWSEEFNLVDPAEFDLSFDTTLQINRGDTLIYDVDIDELTDSLVTFRIWRSEQSEILCPDCWTLTSVPIVDTEYLLFVRTSNGCPGSGTIKAIVDFEYDVYIPNVIWPNSSVPANQLFTVFSTFGVSEITELTIFNRWGDQVYDLPTPFDPSLSNEGWDGEYRGSLSPTGVYVYWVRAMLDDGNNILLSGDFTLLR